MKKFLAMLLSLLMLLTPVLAAAQTPAELLDWAWQNGRAQEVTVSLNINEALLTATGEPEMEMVADIINAMSFSVTTAPQGPWKAALNMDGTEVLNVMGEGDDEMSYLGSTLLGGDVLAANDDEKLVIAGYLVDLMAQNEIITEDDAATFNMLLMMAPYMAEEMLSSIQTVDPESINTAALEAWAAGWESRMESVPVTALPAKCDPAVAGYKFVMTDEDIVALFDASFEMLMSIPAFVQGFIEGSGAENPEQLIAEIRAELESVFAEAPISMPITVYVDENDEAVCVKAEMTVADATASVNDNTVTMTDVAMVIEYTRSTGSNGKVHTTNVTMVDKAAVVEVLVTVDVDNNLNQNVRYTMNMQEAGYGASTADISWTSRKNITDGSYFDIGALNFIVSENVGGVKTANSLGVEYVVNGSRNDHDVGIDTGITLNVDGTEIASLHVETQSCDPLPTLKDGNLVRIGQLMQNSDPEDPASPLNQYLASLEGSVMMNLITIMQNLPASVLSLMLAQ